MNAKLTLSIDKAVIEQAKVYAREQGRSLSNVVEQYLKLVTMKIDDKNHERKIHPEVEALWGCVELPEGKTYDDLKYEYLMEKYMKNE